MNLIYFNLPIFLMDETLEEETLKLLRSAAMLNRSGLWEGINLEFSQFCIASCFLNAQCVCVCVCVC